MTGLWVQNHRFQSYLIKYLTSQNLRYRKILPITHNSNQNAIVLTVQVLKYHSLTSKYPRLEARPSITVTTSPLL
jgi:hypothetical protein